MKSRRMRRMLKRHRAAAQAATPPTPPAREGMSYVLDADGALNVLTASGDVIPFDEFKRCLDELRDTYMGWLFVPYLRRGRDPRDVLADADKLGHRQVAAVMRELLP